MICFSILVDQVIDTSSGRKQPCILEGNFLVYATLNTFNFYIFSLPVFDKEYRKNRKRLRLLA